MAVTFTNPLEVVKTKMQLQGELNLVSDRYKGIGDAFTRIARQEGIRGLQRGLISAYMTQFVMNGTRLGSYENIKESIGKLTGTSGQYSAWKNVVSGATAGCLAAALANPFEMTKTRFQAMGTSAKLAQQYEYTSVFGAFASIVKTEGIAGLWRGVSATVLRTGVGSAVQLSTFDGFKLLFIDAGVAQKDSTMLHLLSSFCSGLLVTIVMNPLDVVRTRLWNQKIVANHSGALYTGPIDCILKTVKSEGVFALYKGFLPHYFRLGPHTTLTLVSWSYLKKISNRNRD